jgi:hypothetical protein
MALPKRSRTAAGRVTTAGAIPDTVPEGTGLLVPPNDVALARALRLISDRANARLATNARAAAALSPPARSADRLPAQSGRSDEEWGKMEA